MRMLNYLRARFYEARAERAFKTYMRLKTKAEKYFRRIGM